VVALAAMHPADLPLEVRDAYEQERAGWVEILALTEPDAVAHHLTRCQHADRDLTDDEVRGWLGR